MATYGAINEERILAAAARVVGKKTISGTRMSLIAEEAELLPSNIQYYFRTKDELLTALLESVLLYFRNERETMMEDAGLTLRDKLSIFFQQKIKSLTTKKDFETANIDFWVQNIVNRKMNRQFHENYLRWRADIRNILLAYIPDLAPDMREYLPHVMVSMVLGSTLQYYVKEDEMDLDKYFSVCLTLIMDEIGGYIEESAVESTHEK